MRAYVHAGRAARNPTVTGYDGVIAINAAGQYVNGHGTPLVLRGVNASTFEAAPYTNRAPANQAWSSNGTGGPPWPTISSWLQTSRKTNIVRMTMNASEWLNVTLGEVTSTSTAATPAWDSSISYTSDQNGILKNAVVNFIQWARYYGMYIIWNCHHTAGTYTFGGVKKFFGAYGQSPFLDADCGGPYWYAALGAGPGSTDAAGYASSGVYAWLCRYFGSPVWNSRLGLAGAGGVVGAAGDFWNPSVGGESGFNDIIFELYNEPYLTGNFSVNLNTASGGSGTALTDAQLMKSGGWVSGYRNQSIGTGTYNVASGGPYHPGLPGASYPILTLSGSGSVISLTMTGYGLGSLSVGQSVTISGVTGATAYNGVWVIASSSIASSTITMTLTGTATGTPTLTSAFVSSGVYGPSGQANTTGDLYGVNWWWQAVGYQTVVTNLRTAGCTNALQCNPKGFATTFSDIHTWFPTDTIVPSQISIGVHAYEYGTTGFAATLDPEIGTAGVLQHWQAFLAGSATYTIGARNYTGLGFAVPLLMDETGDNAGAGTPQPAPYMRSMAQWALGQTDTSTGTSFTGTFGVTPWHFCETPVLAYGSTTTGVLLMTIYGPTFTFTGYTTTTQQAGFPQGTGTITVVNANGNVINPGVNITSGSTGFLPFLGPQISGTPGGAGVYVLSEQFTQGSSGSPVTFTGQYQVPLNGQGLTWAQYG